MFAKNLFEEKAVRFWTVVAAVVSIIAAISGPVSKRIDLSLAMVGIAILAIGVVMTLRSRSMRSQEGQAIFRNTLVPALILVALGAGLTGGVAGAYVERRWGSDSTFRIADPKQNDVVPCIIEVKGTGPAPGAGYEYWVTHQQTKTATHVPAGPHLGATKAEWADGKWATTPLQIGEPTTNAVLALSVYRVPMKAADEWRAGFGRNSNFPVPDPVAEGAKRLTTILVERRPVSKENCDL